jgi:hypothetical protein
MRSPRAKSTDELLPVIEPVFKTLDFPAKDFFDYIAKDSGLLQEMEPGRWDFAHKTFFEYLAAKHWEKHPPTAKDLALWVGQDWWRVALLFFSADSEDSPVIRTALESHDPKALSCRVVMPILRKQKVNAQVRRAVIGTTRAAFPSVVIMDGQSVKTTERAGIRGFDAQSRDAPTIHPIGLL